MANCSILHKNLTDSDIHSSVTYFYANAAARTSAGGFAPTDVGRIALQQDDNSVWMLADESPITWVQLTISSFVGDDTISWTTSFKGNVSGLLYLRQLYQLSTIVSPFVIPFDATLFAITASTDINNNWTAEIYTGANIVVNPSAGNADAILTISGADSGFANNYNVDLNAGTKLAVLARRTSAPNIKDPAVSVFLRRR